MQTVSAQKLDTKNSAQYWKTEMSAKPYQGVSLYKNLYTIQNKISANYYTSQTGFFCNQERTIEKKIKIPLRIRVGSLSYTEQMEGY